MTFAMVGKAQFPCWNFKELFYNRAPFSKYPLLLPTLSELKRIQASTLEIYIIHDHRGKKHYWEPWDQKVDWLDFVSTMKSYHKAFLMFVVSPCPPQSPPDSFQDGHQSAASNPHRKHMKIKERIMMYEASDLQTCCFRKREVAKNNVSNLYNKYEYL